MPAFTIDLSTITNFTRVLSSILLPVFVCQRAVTDLQMSPGLSSLAGTG